MSGVFISYRRSDSRGSAGRIYDNLSEHLGRDRVFRDLDALEPGAEYAGAIETFVRSCDAVVVVMGNQWLEARDERGQRRIDDPSDLVRREIEAALAQSKLVIPVLVEDAVMPEASDLPGQLAGLAGRNALQISDTRWDYDVGRLVQTIDRVLSPGAPSPSPASAGRSRNDPVGSARGSRPVSPAPATGRKYRTIALVALGVVLALVVAVPLLGGGPSDENGATETEQTSETEEEPSETPEPEVTVDPASESAGTEVEISGSGFDPGETVSVSFDGEYLNEGTADDDGAFDGVTLIVPDDIETGEYEVEATGDDSGLAATASFEVL